MAFEEGTCPMATTGLRGISSTSLLRRTKGLCMLATMAFEEGMPPLVTTACDVAMAGLSTTVGGWAVRAAAVAHKAT